MNLNPTVTKHGALDMQVCIPKNWTNEQIKSFAEKEYPCGTTHGWEIRKQGSERLVGKDERVTCSNDEQFCHVMLDA